mgnify:FL=1|tara:strand:+ start:967 stop:1161 length:195 start_codon:yes stop_codon:yes gene_type:complete
MSKTITEYTKTQFQLDMEKCTTEAQREALRAESEAKQNAEMEAEMHDESYDGTFIDMETGQGFY